MQLWKYKYASMLVCKYASMQVYKYASRQVASKAGMIIVKFKPIFIDILERADFSLSAIIASLELTVGSSMNPL